MLSFYVKIATTYIILQKEIRLDTELLARNVVITEVQSYTMGINI